MPAFDLPWFLLGTLFGAGLVGVIAGYLLTKLADR